MQRTSKPWTMLATLIVCLITMSDGQRLLADDPAAKPAADKPTAEKSDAAKDTKEAKPNEPSLLDRLTKELLKQLDDDPGAKPAAAQKEDKLDRAAKGMRSAGERLDESQTDKETRKIQEQVIRDLDELIKQLQNPPPNGGGGGGASGQLSQAQRMLKLGGQQSQSSKQGSAQSKLLSGAEKSGGQEKKVAEGSEERTESERKAAEEAARKKKLEIDVWGHLPPHLRRDMLNTYGERMLPKYENLVKQFYEALSEQKETSPRR